MPKFIFFALRPWECPILKSQIKITKLPLAGQTLIELIGNHTKSNFIIVNQNSYFQTFSTSLTKFDNSQLRVDQDLIDNLTIRLGLQAYIVKEKAELMDWAPTR